MTLTELKQLALNSITAWENPCYVRSEERQMHDYFQAANPQTIISLCEIISEMRDAFEDYSERYADGPSHIPKDAKEALAAYDKRLGEL